MDDKQDPQAMLQFYVCHVMNSYRARKKLFTPFHVELYFKTLSMVHSEGP
jgi:hypothetical protein